MRIVLVDPKYPHNVGGIVRIASCYGVSQVYFTGTRVNVGSRSLKKSARAGKKRRLPREERCRTYLDVELRNVERPLDGLASGTSIIGVEVMPGAEPLHTFHHPQLSCYVFGPEDGSLSKGWRAACHRFVVIPTRHCLNLAVAVGTVLYDRHAKGVGVALTTPGDFEERGWHGAGRDT